MTGRRNVTLRYYLHGLWMLYAAGAIAFLIHDLMAGFNLGRALQAALLWPVMHWGDIAYWAAAGVLSLLG